MSKNGVGLRRAGGSKHSSRIQGLAAGREGGLAPGIHLTRPYLPDTPQDASRDADNTGRVNGVGTKK